MSFCLGTLFSSCVYKNYRLRMYGASKFKRSGKIEKNALFDKFSCYKLCLYVEAIISNTHSARFCRSFLTIPLFMKKYLKLVEELVKELHLLEVEISKKFIL